LSAYPLPADLRVGSLDIAISNMVFMKTCAFLLPVLVYGL